MSCRNRICFAIVLASAVVWPVAADAPFGAAPVIAIDAVTTPSARAAERAAMRQKKRERLAASELTEDGARPARQDRGAWVDPVKDEPAGTHYKTFYSATIQGDVSYLVYLPPDYETAPDRRYPVVYWLHGGGGNQRTGDNFVERLDAAIRATTAPPMIAILVNGCGGSLFCDSLDGQKPVETVIVKDLIPHVDKTHRTYGARAMRAVEGFSMGGFGALHLGFKHPELFGAVTALAHAPIRPDSGWAKVDAVWRTGPFAGNVEYFKPNDPFELVVRNADTIRAGTRVRLIVGDADQPDTVARTKELQARLEGLRIACVFHLVPGVKHSYKNLYEELGDEEFAFYRSVFAAAESAPPTTGTTNE